MVYICDLCIIPSISCLQPMMMKQMHDLAIAIALVSAMHTLAAEVISRSEILRHAY